MLESFSVVGCEPVEVDRRLIILRQQSVVKRERTIKWTFSDQILKKCCFFSQILVLTLVRRY